MIAICRRCGISLRVIVKGVDEWEYRRLKPQEPVCPEIKGRMEKQGEQTADLQMDCEEQTK